MSSYVSDVIKAHGSDYVITVKRASFCFGIFAVHGGVIDLGTDTLAREIAGNEHSLYIFNAAASALRVPSTKFDEPDALKLASEVDTVISLHGERNRETEYIMLGGLDEEMKHNAKHYLTRNGYRVLDPREELAGKEQENICNRGRTGRGVQIEISRALRKRMYEDTRAREKFVHVIRSVLT